MMAGFDRWPGASPWTWCAIAIALTGARVAPCASPPPGAHAAPEVVGGGSAGITVVNVPDPNDPVVRAAAERARRMQPIEKELKQIRAKYFRGTKNTEMRQVGISQLRKFDDPAVYPLLVDLFRDEDEEARRAVLDHLSGLKNDEADATVAWTAVFDKSKTFRADAAKRVTRRAAEAGEVSHRVQSVVATGLRSKKDETVAAAAELASLLKLYEAIPMLISAQVSGAGGGGSGESDGSLAYILVGQQVAFVSDLQPVVGDSAVAFDPTVSVATEGVILRVIDAYVITYRVDVHNALVGLANAGWDGRDTSAMGWDNAKWNDWYGREFVPHRAKLEAKAEGAPKAAESAKKP